eukprot:CAMPEP_0194312184 /NCGR_PEP_ID=MMETSP0171-20130528/9112_1 /TAXON_ID=218684 /ORGANISM="Corethron pennatum, Strain L29A3" /LENGTH=966 /DNA_ID=CAMNT_0039066593 /DNA_START=77 /DNA_END=2977 /DNA_ORIENTATION=+
MLPPEKIIPAEERDISDESSRTNKLLDNTIAQIGELASAAQKRARKAEKKVAHFKFQLEDSRKKNEMKEHELSTMERVVSDAKAKATRLEGQFNGAKKVHESEIRAFKNKIKIATDAELNAIKNAEAEALYLKSQLSESQKVSQIKTQELDTMKKFANDAEANFTRSKHQFDDAKKVLEGEMQDIQKKLEIATKAKLFVTSQSEAEIVYLKSQLNESQEAIGIKTQKLNKMKDINDAAKANTTRLKHLFNDARKIHEVDIQDLQKKLKIAINTELDVIKRAKNSEAEAIYLKSQLNELQKMHLMKTQELNTMKDIHNANSAILKDQLGNEKKIHKVEMQDQLKKSEGKLEKMSNEFKENITILKGQLHDEMKRHEAEMKVTQKNLEIATEVKLDVIKRAKNIEAEVIFLKSQLNESKKVNVMKTQEINKMTDITNEAKTSITDLKHQLSDSKKLHEVEMQNLQKKLENVKLNSINKAKDAEAGAVYLKSQVSELQKVNGIQMQELNTTKDMANKDAMKLKQEFEDTKKAHRVEIQGVQKKAEIAFNAELQRMADGVKANATSLKQKFNGAKKVHVAEMQVIQNKLELATKAELDVIKRAKDSETEAACLKSQLNESQKANMMKKRELDTMKDMANANVNSLKDQLDNARKKSKDEMQDQLKKMESATRAHLDMAKVAKDSETEVAHLKFQLHESQKGNAMMKQELDTMKEMANEVKVNATNLKRQFDDAKKLHEGKEQKLQKNIEIANKAELELKRRTEADAANLEFQLSESRKANETNTQELNTVKNMFHESKGQVTSLKHQFSHAKKVQEVVIHDLQEKLESATKARLDFLKRVKNGDDEVACLKSQLNKSKDISNEAKLKVTSLKHQLDNAKKVHERDMKDLKEKSEISFKGELQKMASEVKMSATSLKKQFDDAKKEHEAEMQIIQKKLEIANEAKLDVFRRAEASATYLKSILEEMDEIEE